MAEQPNGNPITGNREAMEATQQAFLAEMESQETAPTTAKEPAQPATEVAPEAPEQEANQITDDGLEFLDDESSTDEAPLEDTTENEVTEQDDDAQRVIDENQLDNYRVLTKVNGEEKYLPLSEIRKGYQIDAVNTQKSQSLAEEKKVIQQREDELSKVIPYLSQAANQYTQKLQSEIIEPDKTLEQTDPIKYNQQVADYVMKSQQLQQAKEDAKQAQEVAQQQAMVQHQQRVQSEYTKLQERIPHLKDPVKRQKISKEMAKYATEIGYSNEEFAQLFDHRDATTLFKAMQWDRLQSRKSTTLKEVAPKPKVGTMKSSARRSNNEVGQQRYKDAKAKLRKTGDVRDAAAVFLNHV